MSTDSSTSRAEAGIAVAMHATSAARILPIRCLRLMRPTSVRPALQMGVVEDSDRLGRAGYRGAQLGVLPITHTEFELRGIDAVGRMAPVGRNRVASIE